MYARKGRGTVYYLIYQQYALTHITMSRKERTMHAVQAHPVRTGLFAVLAVIATGTLAGFWLGYASPDSADAAIIVTAPPPPPPVIIIPPPPPPVIVTPVTPTPPATPTPGSGDASGNTSDDSSDSSSDSDSGDSDNNTVDDEITVIGETDDPGGATTPPADTLPPCCTDTTPSTNPPADTDTPPADDLPPCCSEVTTPVVPPADTLPPCCTETPITPVSPPTPPVTPVNPPIIPPVNPPPPSSESAYCELLASSSTIASGDPVTLSWKTKNAHSITIIPGVGTFTGSQAASGSTVVYPTKTTSYVGTVSNGTQSVHCRAVVQVVPPSENAARCVLVVSSSTVASGDPVTLSWKTENVNSITIDQGVGTFTGSNAVSGSTVVHPTKDTIYTGTVSNGAQSIHCRAAVYIENTPPEDTSRCIFLTASDTNVEKGDEVTISWKTENADSVTITNVGTFTGSKAASGSAVVHPTADTTYKASVEGDENNPNCMKKVTVGSTSHNDHVCVYLKADDTDVDEGDTVTLSWKTDNASSITIDNGVGKVTPVDEGSIKVTVDDDTTYHASVPGDEDNPNCTVSIDVDTGGGGGGGGHHHGGGSSKPDVYFNSSNRPAAPLASVYLSQIPYTGLDLGPVGTAVYWTLLVLWSLAAAYLVLFGGIPFVRRRLAAFGANVSDALNSDAAPAAGYSLHGYGAQGAHAMPQGGVPAAQHDVHGPSYAAPMPSMPQVMQRTAQAPAPAAAPRLQMTGDGFKRFASAGSSLTIDDIVKGLSRESGMEFSAEPQPESRPQHDAAEAYAPVREAAAPAAEERPEPQQRAAQAQPAREARVEAAPVHPEVTGFIASILEGERDAVFGTIRRLTQAGHDAEEFMAHAICALDDAYRARIDGTPVHEDVKQVTDHCATSFLERLVTALTTAVDGSYAMGITGIKLALTRALAVSQG